MPCLLPVIFNVEMDCQEEFTGNSLIKDQESYKMQMRQKRYSNPKVLTKICNFVQNYYKQGLIKQKMKKLIPILLILLIVYIVIGAIFPFIHQPVISKITAEKVYNNKYTGVDTIGERAYIVSDNGEALEERIRMIAQAKEKIILSTFEFRSDESGKKILAALFSAAERGVQVQILVDGSTELIQMKGNEYFHALSDLQNVEMRIYNPISLLRPWSIMGRLHDKYIIADDKLYILGGRNTYDYFLGDQESYKNYDWDVLIYNEEIGQGESMKQLLAYFTGIWNLPECKEFKNKIWNKDSLKQAKEDLITIYKNMQQEQPEWFQTIDYYRITKPVNHIQLITNPTTRYAKEPVVFYAMTQLMQNAKEEVIFHTPYIICNDWMLEEIADVSKVVPKVTMLTNSVANNGNPFGAMDYQNNKEKILDTGIQILEYDGGISYHGKCFVIDNNLSAIGSFNWDMRSTYIDTELMLIIDSEAINKDLREAMGEYEEKSLLVTGEGDYIIPDGMVPQEISKKRERRIKLIQVFGKPFRFLM